MVKIIIHSVHNGPDIEEIIRIPDVMFNAARLRRRNFYDELMNTMLRQPMQQVDSGVTFGVSFLFRFFFIFYYYIREWRCITAHPKIVKR